MDIGLHHALNLAGIQGNATMSAGNGTQSSGGSDEKDGVHAV